MKNLLMRIGQKKAIFYFRVTLFTTSLTQLKEMEGGKSREDGGEIKLGLP